MHTPFSLSRRKLVANKKRTCCLMKVMNWRLGMTQVGWAGTSWHNRKMIMYWTYCAIEGLATVWTCIINQEIQYEKEETRCRETRQSSSLDILDLSVAKPFIAILNLLVGGDVWNVFYTPWHYHYALFFWDSLDTLRQWICSMRHMFFLIWYDQHLWTLLSLLMFDCWDTPSDSHSQSLFPGSCCHLNGTVCTIVTSHKTY